MNRKLKILHIIVQGRLRSGGGIQLYLLAKELVNMGHHVCAIYNKNDVVEDDFAVFENTGINVKFFAMARAKLNKSTLMIVKQLRSFLKKEQFDIIHAHKGNAVDLVWLATTGLNMNIVTNRGVISPLDFFQGFKYRTKKLKRIIAVSRAVKDVMVETAGIDPEKVSVVYGGVDINEFKPGIVSTIRREYNISEDQKVIGYVGSALPRKGLKYLIEAFEILNEKYKKLVLLLVGVTHNDLKNYRVKNILKNSVIPAGFRKDVAQCMAGFTVFAFSGTADEGLTGTVREAAAIGLPVVTTDVGGNSELICNNKNGLVVPKKDPQALAAALEFLLENREKAEMFGKNAREFVVQNMSSEVRSQAIEKIYYEIVGG